MAAAPAPAANQPKVLRIGIIVEGKIVQERLIKPGEAVTIGDSQKNTFVIGKNSLPRQDFPLFVAKGGKYQLQFTEKMKGKVGAGGQVVGLDKVRTDPAVQREGPLFKMALSEQDRGKIQIDQTTVLFQFVTAPPVAAGKPSRVDFRPRLVEEDDALLFGFLCLFSAIGAIFVIWVWNSEVQEITSIEQLDERWTKLIIEEPKPPEEEIADLGKTEEKKEEKKEQKEEKKAETDAAKPTKTAEQIRQEKKDEIAKKSAMLQFLVTRGQSDGGEAKDLWAEGAQGIKDIDAALKGATGVEAADSTDGLRGDAGGPGSDADIGALGQIGGGESKVAEGPKVKIAVDVGEGSADEMEMTDQQAVKKVVTKNSGQLKYCYESRLKANPDLNGRVEIEWNIAGGRVTSAQVFANTTGDSELADCITQKIKRWTFDSQIEGEVLWPFIFRQAT
jgi:hypothetical protein